jgi:hypothetical protein
MDAVAAVGDGILLAVCGALSLWALHRAWRSNTVLKDVPPSSIIRSWAEADLIASVFACAFFVQLACVCGFWLCDALAAGT